MTWAETIKAELLRKGLGDDYSSCDLPGCWHSNDPNLVDVARTVWREHGLRPPMGFEARGLTREIKATPARQSQLLREPLLDELGLISNVNQALLEREIDDHQGTLAGVGAVGGDVEDPIEAALVVAVEPCRDGVAHGIPSNLWVWSESLQRGWARQYATHALRLASRSGPSIGCRNHWSK